MEITVFVKWHKNKILTHKEFEKEVESETLERFNDDCYFAEWLEENYSIVDIFNFNDEEKKAVREAFKAYCEKEAYADTLKSYDMVELEI